jgi:hypothetical protein
MIYECEMFLYTYINMIYSNAIDMKTKALITTPIAIRAENCTAEAVQVLQTHYPASGCESQGETCHSCRIEMVKTGFFGRDKICGTGASSAVALCGAAREALWG